jgi:YHS domain-containing protein
MTYLRLVLAVSLIGLLAACGTPYATVSSSQSEPVMLLGHDPTAYFTGGAPVRGKPELKVSYPDRTYYFASAESREMFRASPWKYEPQYGGFCANGAAYGFKQGSDPTAWQIRDGRLFIFGDAQGKLAWQVDPDWHIAHADLLWPQARPQGWRYQNVKQYVDKVPHYRTDAQIRQEWQEKNPGQAWPVRDSGGTMTNLLFKQPGWRAAEGFGQPALGYPQ